MDIFETIQKRFSCRRYKPQPVEEEKLIKVLEAARLAPSAHNAQDWKFIIVKNEMTRKQLAKAAGQLFVAQSPVIIVAVALDSEHILSSGVPAYALNLAIAVDHMTLAAAALGLATCWIGAFDQQEVKRILEIPQEYKVVALLPLGYPAQPEGRKLRKSLEEIVCWDKFENKEKRSFND
jgi:nitroreductase